MTLSERLRTSVEGIVIGGSAGGVEALSLLLPALPARLRPAVFIVIHQPREPPGPLAAIFCDKCTVQVREAEDKEKVSPGVVYFAPPDYHLLIDAGPQLALSADEPVQLSRPSIDVLFESAAEVYGPRLMGVVLTGASQDGAQGLAAVQRCGGITVVQHPASARAEVMPVAALRRTPADFVLALEELAALFRTLPRASA